MIAAVASIIKPPATHLALVLKEHWVSLTGSGATWFAAITARQEQAEWWLKMTATGAALMVSTLTAIHIVKNWNKK